MATLFPRPSVSKGSGWPASGPGLDRENVSVRFQTNQETRPADSWRAKPGPVPVNLRVSPGWLDPSVPISRSVFWVSHLWSHSDMLLWIVKYWHCCVTVHFRCISCLDIQNKHTDAPNHIPKMSVNRASTERQQYLVLHCVSPIRAANDSSMTDYNLSEVWFHRTHDQKSLTLRWRSFSGCGRARLSTRFGY